MNSRTFGLYALITGLLLAASSSHAQLQRTLWTNAAGDREFTNAGNWTLLEQPGLPGNSPDAGTTNAIIQSAGPVNLTSNFAAANPFDVLIIRSGLTLNISADMDLNGSPILLAQTGTGNAINQSSGTVSATNLTIGDGGGVYNLSGGSLNLTGSILVRNDSGLSLQGDTASISATSLTLSQNTGGTPNLDLRLGPTGINAISLSGSFNIDSTFASLSIDGSSFTGGPGTYELVTYGSRSGAFADPSKVSFTGLFNGYQTAISYDADSLNLVLTVPEPSTVLGILGLGIAALMRRPRRKHTIRETAN